VLRGTGSRTRWSEAGVGNHWDTYRGFDFDGDGRGESRHPILGPFERLEGHNPATRLFLRSPAASALELAARFAPDVRGEVTDDAPLTGRTARSHAAEAPRLASVLAALAVIGVAAAAWKVELRACSR
jgi:nitrous oxidase accessory protein